MGRQRLHVSHLEAKLLSEVGARGEFGAEQRGRDMEGVVDSGRADEHQVAADRAPPDVLSLLMAPNLMVDKVIRHLRPCQSNTFKLEVGLGVRAGRRPRRSQLSTSTTWSSM